VTSSSSPPPPIAAAQPLGNPPLQEPVSQDSVVCASKELAVPTASVPWWASHSFRRVQTGALAALFVLFCLIMGGLWWLGFVAFVVTVGFYELRYLLLLQKCRASTSAYFLTVIPMLACAYFGKEHLLVSFLTVGALYIFFISLFKKPRVSMSDIGSTLFAILYMGFFPIHILMLRNMGLDTRLLHQEGFAYVLLMFAVVAAADTGAYYVGKRFGRHPLHPEVSPKKTFEGAAGGVLAGLLMGSVIASWQHLPLGHTLVLSVILVVVGALGDLVESKLKRDSGVKDSGQWLDTHGGLLDRVDSYLLSAAVAYYYVHWAVHHQGLVQDVLEVSKAWF
jgi:phosphatidate cytidylyltransferase